MDAINDMLNPLENVWGAVVVLAVLVTGFNLGLRWLQKGMGDNDEDTPF